MEIELDGKKGDVDDELDFVHLDDSFLVRDFERGREWLAEDELDLAQVETAFITLRWLWISGSCTAAQVVLSCEVCHYGLDNLTILRVTNSFPSNTTFAPHLTDGLSASPKLRWLLLEFDSLQPYPRRSRFLPIWDLGMLDVTGPLVDPVLATFIEQCPSLTTFALRTRPTAWTSR